MTQKKWFWGIVAPLASISFSILITSIILLIKGASVMGTYKTLWDFGIDPSNLVTEVNQTVAYYLAGVAAAIGFKMLLFNIGIDGQYRLAVFFSAVVGAQLHLPPVLHILVIMITAVSVGALWAMIAGYLKVKRNISEVISNIMLNTIASGLITYLLQPSRLGYNLPGSNNSETPPVPKSGWLPSFHVAGANLYSYIFVAIAIGILYWVLLNKSVFGFNLRATGMSFRAARASGINAPRMIFITMAISGGVAGLTGLGEMMGNTHNYSLSFPNGYALTGLALALIGRSSPIGIALAAFFWSFLEGAAPALDLYGVPVEIVTVMQAIIIISTVVSYEIVKRINLLQQQKLVGAAAVENTTKVEVK